MSGVNFLDKSMLITTKRYIHTAMSLYVMATKRQLQNRYTAPNEDADHEGDLEGNDSSQKGVTH